MMAEICAPISWKVGLRTEAMEISAQNVEMAKMLAQTTAENQAPNSWKSGHKMNAGHTPCRPSYPGCLAQMLPAELLLQSLFAVVLNRRSRIKMHKIVVPFFNFYIR